MSPHPVPLPALYVPALLQQRGERERERGDAIFNEFALEHEIVTLAWIDNASVQFPLNIYATKGGTMLSAENNPNPSAFHCTMRAVPTP